MKGLVRVPDRVFIQERRPDNVDYIDDVDRLIEDLNKQGGVLWVNAKNVECQ